MKILFVWPCRERLNVEGSSESHFLERIWKRQDMKVSIVIERDRQGYYAYCPELQGCHTQGASLDEVLENIKEAVEL